MDLKIQKQSDNVIKREILDILEDYDIEFDDYRMTFSEVLTQLEGRGHNVRGMYDIRIGELIVFWQGLSLDVAEAFRDLWRDGLIQIEHIENVSEIVNYLRRCKEAPRLPQAYNLNPEAESWLPAWVWRSFNDGEDKS